MLGDQQLMSNCSFIVVFAVCYCSLLMQRTDILVPAVVLTTYTCSHEYLRIASRALLMRRIAQYILAHPFVNTVSTRPLNSLRVLVYPKGGEGLSHPNEPQPLYFPISGLLLPTAPFVLRARRSYPTPPSGSRGLDLSLYCGS